MIPDSVTEIGWSAFEDCSSLTSIKLSDALTEIEDNAFRGCKHLAGIEIPDSVKKIGKGVFYGCDLPENVKKELTVKFGGYIFENYEP